VKRKILNCHKQTEGFGLPFLSIEGGKAMDLFSMISEVSFPILVSIYLLYRMETKLDQLTKSIQDLTIALSRSPQNL
jgi:hypothetical protein